MNKKQLTKEIKNIYVEMQYLNLYDETPQGVTPLKDIMKKKRKLNNINRRRSYNKKHRVFKPSI